MLSVPSNDLVALFLDSVIFNNKTMHVAPLSYKIGACQTSVNNDTERKPGKLNYAFRTVPKTTDKTN